MRVSRGIPVEVSAIVGGGVGGRMTFRFGRRCREGLVVDCGGLSPVVTVRTPHRFEKATSKEQVGGQLNCQWLWGKRIMEGELGREADIVSFVADKIDNQNRTAGFDETFHALHIMSIWRFRALPNWLLVSRLDFMHSIHE